MSVLQGAHRKSKQARANDANQCSSMPPPAHTGQPALAQPLDAPGRPGAAPMMSAFGPAAAANANAVAAVSAAAGGGAFGGGNPPVWCMGAGGPLGGSTVAHGPHSPGTGMGVGSNRQQSLALGAQGHAASSAPGTLQQQQQQQQQQLL